MVPNQDDRAGVIRSLIFGALFLRYGFFKAILIYLVAAALSIIALLGLLAAIVLWLEPIP
jgi:hypothetical protein